MALPTTRCKGSACSGHLFTGTATRSYGASFAFSGFLGATFSERESLLAQCWMGFQRGFVTPRKTLHNHSCIAQQPQELPKIEFHSGCPPRNVATDDWTLYCTVGDGRHPVSSIRLTTMSSPDKEHCLLDRLHDAFWEAFLLLSTLDFESCEHPLFRATPV